jgi:hypothetical protein
MLGRCNVRANISVPILVVTCKVQTHVTCRIINLILLGLDQWARLARLGCSIISTLRKTSLAIYHEQPLQ